MIYRYINIPEGQTSDRSLSCRCLAGNPVTPGSVRRTRRPTITGRMVGKLDMEQNKDGWRVYVKNKEGDKTSIKKKRKKKQNKKGKII